MSETDILEPRPGARRRAALVIGLGVVAGIGAIWAASLARPAVEAWVTAPSGAVEQAARLRVVIAVTVVATSLPLAALAAYLWRLGTRVLADERFPPAGTPVLRRTPIVRGSAARWHGRAIRLVAVTLAVTVAGMALIWWRLSSMLDGGS